MGKLAGSPRFSLTYQKILTIMKKVKDKEGDSKSARKPKRSGEGESLEQVKQN